MRSIRVGIPVVCAVMLSGCTANVMGSQTIALAVIPPSAQCDAFEHSERVGSYDANQRTLTVPKSLGSLDIVCSAPGYKDKRVNVVPDNNAAGKAGAALLDYGPFGGRIGYPQTVLITMESADRQGLPR